MPSRTMVYEGVKAILVDILGIEPEDITPTANFFDDLGGESIDVLDLTFHCEKQFGAKIRFQDLADPSQIETDPDGQISESTLTSLEGRFPFLDLAEFRASRTMKHIHSLFTVDTIVRFVEHALAQQECEEEVVG